MDWVEGTGAGGLLELFVELFAVTLGRAGLAGQAGGCGGLVDATGWPFRRLGSCRSPQAFAGSAGTGLFFAPFGSKT